MAIAVGASLWWRLRLVLVVAVALAMDAAAVAVVLLHGSSVRSELTNHCAA